MRRCPPEVSGFALVELLLVLVALALLAILRPAGRTQTGVGWGDSAHGQSTPPPATSNTVTAAAGGAHSVALLPDGTVIAWGNNANG